VRIGTGFAGLTAALTVTVVLNLAPRTGASADARPQGRPSASEARERLAFLEGTWTRPETPAGQTFRETCAWMGGGRRHMVCRQRTETAESIHEQMLVYSYRGADATYMVTVFLAGGQVWRYEGQPDGDRWVFDLIPTGPAAPQRLRQVLTPRGDEIRFREEVSEKGGPWRLTDPSEEYVHVRVRGSAPRTPPVSP
jgi:hypothetical protein